MLATNRATSGRHAVSEALSTKGVSDTFLRRILEPYFPHCQYVQQAQISHDPAPTTGVIPRALNARGEFSIPKSCYIEDTGHFNAVEFVICYNQLGYLLLGEAFCSGLIKPLPRWDIESFEAKQLPDVLILQINSSYRREINARKFFGEIHWDFARIKDRHLFIKTRVNFFDEAGGEANGDAFVCVRNVVPQSTALAN